MPHKKKDTALITIEVSKRRDFKRYLHFMSSPWHMMWSNFIAGTFHGLGFVVGSAVLLGLVGYFTSKLVSNLPFFSELVETVNVWMEITQSAQ